MFLGGQTIIKTEDFAPVIFLDYMVVKSEKEKSLDRYVSVFDGKGLININVSEVDYIFQSNPSLLTRTMYYGDYCNMKFIEGIDEDVVLNDKKAAAAHLRSVKSKIKNKQLFIKDYGK
jgi:hypothetical protein